MVNDINTSRLIEVFCKNAAWKILQNLKENTCDGSALLTLLKFL